LARSSAAAKSTAVAAEVGISWRRRDKKALTSGQGVGRTHAQSASTWRESVNAPFTPTNGRGFEIDAGFLDKPQHLPVDRRNAHARRRRAFRRRCFRGGDGRTRRAELEERGELARRRERNLSGEVETLAVARLRERVREALSADGAAKLELTLTQDELAAFIGASRVSVNRVLGDLERREIIGIRRRHIVIVDPERLAKEIRV